MMLGTFTCGLYHIADLETEQPRLGFSYAFPGDDCAVPVRIGRWWIQTVPAERGLIALDVSDPAQPRETSRITFAEPADPHWLAADRSHRWLVMTSGMPTDPSIHLVGFDPSTGSLSHHPDLPSVDLSRVYVPGIGVVHVIPHGAVFGHAKE